MGTRISVERMWDVGRSRDGQRYRKRLIAEAGVVHAAMMRIQRDSATRARQVIERERDRLWARVQELREENDKLRVRLASLRSRRKVKR